MGNLQPGPTEADGYLSRRKLGGKDQNLFFFVSIYIEDISPWADPFEPTLPMLASGDGLDPDDIYFNLELRLHIKSSLP